MGLAIGVTPLWGVHWLLLGAVCLPLRLDARVAWLASNVSLPFFAPFITFAEIEIGARVLRGAWLDTRMEELVKMPKGLFALELVVGTVVVAVGASALGGALAYAALSLRRRFARPA